MNGEIFKIEFEFDYMYEFKIDNTFSPQTGRLIITCIATRMVLVVTCTLGQNRQYFLESGGALWWGKSISRAHEEVGSRDSTGIVCREYPTNYLYSLTF